MNTEQLITIAFATTLIAYISRELWGTRQSLTFKATTAAIWVAIFIGVALLMGKLMT